MPRIFLTLQLEGSLKAQSSSWHTLPLPCPFTALLSYSPRFHPTKLKISLPVAEKLNPREQSNSSEHPFPGQGPVLEYNFANLPGFSEVWGGCKTVISKHGFLTANISPNALQLIFAIHFLKHRERARFSLEPGPVKEGRGTTPLSHTLPQPRTAAHREEMLPSASGGLRKCVTGHCHTISLHNANASHTIEQLTARLRACTVLSLPSKAQG